MTTPRTASTTDARKRQADRETAEQPPQFPDTTGWVKREPGDVIEAGTPFVYQTQPTGRLTFHPAASLNFTAPFPSLSGTAYWTPPPAPAPVWSVISTDRDQPTLARFTYGSDVSETRLVFRDDHFIYDADSDDNLGRLDCIARVELLDTHDPETQVPVERALIDEAVQIADSFDVDPAWPFRFVDKIAALADGAEKGADQ